jgi:dipeptidyl aminopeptidase/acylaminoacyl peptidase
MREERVWFYSGTDRVAGILRRPEGPAGPLPTIVQGPGWLQLKEARRNTPYHQALTAAGFAVLIFDYRGFGESGGDPTEILPDRQVEDLVNAVTYLTTRDDVDAEAIGVFGSGSLGGSNAIALAGGDPRIRCAVSQVPIADGEDWLRRMRRESEWYEFLAELDEDRRARVLNGQGKLVHPRGGIMVTTPERAARKDTQDGHVREVSLRSAEAIMAYKPIEAAARASGLLVIGVDRDPVTPTDHAVALYRAAIPPKKLIIQRRTTHYAAYTRYADEVIPQIIAWFTEHLRGGPIDVRTTPLGGVEERTTIGQAEPRPGPGSEERSDRGQA